MQTPSVAERLTKRADGLQRLGSRSTQVAVEADVRLMLEAAHALQTKARKVDELREQTCPKAAAKSKQLWFAGALVVLPQLLPLIDLLLADPVIQDALAPYRIVLPIIGIIVAWLRTTISQPVALNPEEHG